MIALISENIVPSCDFKGLLTSFDIPITLVLYSYNYFASFSVVCSLQIGFFYGADYLKQIEEGDVIKAYFFTSLNLSLVFVYSLSTSIRVYKNNMFEKRN